MRELTCEQVKNMLLYVADQVIESKPYLTEVDSQIGDGDHGIGMAGGMKKASDVLSKLSENDNAYFYFQEMGKAMLMSMGGASGVIFGTMFMGGAKGKEASAVLSIPAFTTLMADSLNQIKIRGKAQVGDKTMVDALEPAVLAMQAYAGDSFVELLDAATAAAAQGVENTKQYQAKFGRSKSLLERAIGFQDAGATSVWIIFRSMAEFVKKA